MAAGYEIDKILFAGFLFVVLRILLQQHIPYLALKQCHEDVHSTIYATLNLK